MDDERNEFGITECDLENGAGNKAPSIVIADDNLAGAQALAKKLKEAGFNVLPLCVEGRQAIEMLHRYKVDAMIIEAVLPDLDGFEVVANICQCEKSIKPLLFFKSAINSVGIISYLNEAGVEYIFNKPTDYELFIEQIRAGIKRKRQREKACNAPINPAPEVQNEPQSFNERLHIVVTDLIRAIGIPAHVKGYNFLRYGIEIFAINKSHKTNLALSKDIYPMIAEKFRTKPQNVERNIRNAIDIAWKRGDIESIFSLFGYTVSFERGKPTNQECIAMLADRALMILAR